MNSASCATAEGPYVAHAYRGSSGSHVAAYERMLARWAGEEFEEAHAVFTATTAARVRAFQRAETEFRPTGSIGPGTHEALLAWADDRAVELLREEYERRHPRPSARQIVVSAALCALAKRGSLVYSGRNRATVRRRWQGIDEGIAPPEVPRYADCSSLATWCLWLARDLGAEDPSGGDWSPGSTVSMERLGREVELEHARPGSLFFYANDRTGGHVAIMVERVRNTPFLVSFGFEGGPSYLRYDYRLRLLGRNDLTSVRDYIED
jgi:cell wall-associated NlpC family hydrolase